MVILSINAQDYTVSPENGSVLDALTDIIIKWDNATTVTVDPMMMVGGAKVYMVDGDNKTAISDIFCGPATGNTATMSLMSATNNAGEYIIEIPDAMFTVDNVAVDAFTLNYTIGGIPTSNATIDIQCDNGSLSTIFITVSPCQNLAINDDENIELPFIVYNAGMNSFVAASYTITITGSNTATLSTEKELSKGNYTLQIPKGKFIIDEKVNPLIMKDFEISAIHSVTIDEEEINVYDLRGTQVIKNGTPQQLDRLTPGIYIVNGVKKLLQGK